MTSPDSAPLPLQRDHRVDQRLALGAVLLGLATRLPFVTADEGWYDEHFSILTAGLPLRDVLREVLAEQSNPPGYYLMAHVWGLLGGSTVPWHRLLPALSGALLPAVLLLAARRLGLSRWGAMVAAALALAAPMLWQMSLEIRTYAPLALVTTAAMWLAAGIAQETDRPRRAELGLLAGAQLLMVMLHYFAALSVAGITFGLLAAARVNRAARAGELVKLGASVAAPAAVALAGWLGLAFLATKGAGGRNVSWIPETAPLAALRTVPELLLANMGPIGRWMSYGLLLGALLIAIRWSLGQGDAWRLRRASGRFLLLAAVLPIALAFTLHLAVGGDLWVPRYLTGFVPGLALLAAIVVDAAPHPSRRVLALGIAAWWLVAGAFYFAGRWPKPDWTTIIAQLAPTGRGTLCTGGSFVGLPFIFHARAQGLEQLRVVSPARCAPGDGPTWFVYDVERSGVTPTPALHGLLLGPRVVLFRGMQNLDARRVIGVAPPTATPKATP